MRLKMDTQAQRLFREAASERGMTGEQALRDLAYGWISSVRPNADHGVRTILIEEVRDASKEAA